MSSGATDSAVIKESLNTPHAFAEIYDRHFTAIHGYIARRVGPDVADDISGEVFTVAFARRHTYKLDRPNALPWLYGIVGNLLRNHWRLQARDWRLEQRVGNHREHVVTHIDELEHSRVDAAKSLVGLNAALAQLSEEDRTTLLLYAWEDLSYPEIAEALDIPIGTVRS